MGYQDRDYFKNKSIIPPEHIPPVKNNPPLIFAFICFGVGLVHSLAQGNGLYVLFDNSPGAIFSGKIWSLIFAPFATSGANIFLHAISAYFIALMVCQDDTFKRFVNYYIVFGLLSAVPFYLFSLTAWRYIHLLPGPQVWLYSSHACLMIFAYRRPKQVIHLFFILPIQVRYLVAFYFLLSFSFFVQGSNNTYVMASFLGNVSSFLFAFVYARYSFKIDWFLKNLKPSRVSKSIQAEAQVKEMSSDQVKAEVDRLLDKIAEKGLSSLSESEKQFLKKSSSKYK